MAKPTTIMIGRSSTNDVCLGENDTTISRQHAEIVIAQSGSILLTDCASTCGTHLRANGGWSAINQHIVERQDEVLLGDANTILTVDELLRMGGH